MSLQVNRFAALVFEALKCSTRLLAKRKKEQRFSVYVQCYGKIASAPKSRGFVEGWPSG
jgi:hypothetical protein